MLCIEHNLFVIINKADNFMLCKHKIYLILHNPLFILVFVKSTIIWNIIYVNSIYVYYRLFFLYLLYILIAHATACYNLRVYNTSQV